jgi:hypothetical protein
MNVKEFELNGNMETEGITEDFIWYESEILRKDMQMWSHRFEKLVKVAEARHKEHIKMLQDVMQQNHLLKKQIAKLKGEENEG